MSRLPWTTAQEKTIARDYPLSVTEQWVVRVYLQFLWLPNSIMPLNMLVPTLLRNPQSAAPTQHSLLVHLEPLLIGSRAISNKFHVELPQILSDGGGVGEIEESMMWFALKHEKAPADDGSTSHAEPWLDETWRTTWLDRQEKREVQVQILLQLLKLSLEGGGGEPAAAEHARLESLMDKMSMWQLVDRLDDSSQPLAQADGKRDWMQTFCEDIVEPQFKAQLPDWCALLRSKVFPHSPFADDSSRSPTPTPLVPDPDFTNTSQPASPSGLPHPIKASLARSKRQINGTTQAVGLDHHHTTTDNTSRSRSRSLSVTLSQDPDARRAGSVGTNKKRLFTREVSMSRTFKNRGKDDTAAGRKPTTTQQKESVRVEPEIDMGVTLVAASPVKSGARQRSH